MIDANKLKTVLDRGGIIAYPTEAVYGLGCDPLNEHAVKRLLHLKQRPIEKGLIIVGSEWQQLTPFLEQLDPAIEDRIKHSRAKPTTWICPSKADVPTWLTGQHNSIAVRVSKHPCVQALCRLWGKALVSTSANIADQPSAKTADKVHDIFLDSLDWIMPGEVGTLDKPTDIFDAISGKQLR